MKLGLSCSLSSRWDYEKAFSIYRKAGFDTIELGLSEYGINAKPNDIYNASQDEFESFFTNVKKAADNIGIEFSSTHGRMKIFTPDEEECKIAKWAAEKDLQASAILGAPLCVMHSIVNSDWSDRYDDEDFLYSKNAEFFNSIVPVAEANNIKITLETYGKTKINGKPQVTFFAHAHQMKKQFETLNTKNKTICVDIGHTNEAHYWGALSPGDTIRYLGSDVTHLHLHDNNGTVDLHSTPLFDKRGCIDWADIFDALDEINYSGVYNFECRLSQYGPLLEDAICFFGKYFRYIVENKGRIG